MVTPRKISIFTVIILFHTCFWGFSRSPLPDNKGQAELPSDLKGAKVYHLPEKSSEKTKSDLAVVRSVAYQEISLDQLTLNLFVRMKPG